MEYDFDHVIDRRGTDCVKWQFRVVEDDLAEWAPDEGCLDEDGVLPLWVADMDFPSPQPVIDALVNRARHGVYGYTARSKGYEACIRDWMFRRYAWEIETDWITTTPGVVNALFQIVQAFSKPGEKVIFQPPVYHPFKMAIETPGRVPAPNALLLRGDRYEMDFEGLEALARDPAVRIALLCSPHNPVGRVWSPEELRRFGAICAENGVLVVSDEVHGDLIYAGQKFTTYAVADPANADNALVCTAPSKTFNLPGLKTSNIIIADAGARKRLNAQLDLNGIWGIPAFGSTALQAAYQHGEDWLSQVMAYIERNYRFLKDFFDAELPQARIIPPEGTYLVWADLRAYRLSGGELHDRLLEEGRVYLDNGGIFGDEGEGFTRINIACPRSILAEALERMAGVLKAIAP